MTNEEKAIEVYPTRHLKGEEREKMRERRRGFFAGANWKDVQFEEVIAQLRQWLYEHGKLDKLDLVEFDMEMTKLWEDKK